MGGSNLLITFYIRFAGKFMSSRNSRGQFFIKAFICLIMLGLFLTTLNKVPIAKVKANESPKFHNFEAPQVHPITLTPDGSKLLVTNTADNRLSVFQMVEGVPTLVDEIPVGLQPVSVAARNDQEVWVANWLSDSISIVDLKTKNVKQTIDVGDEPTDIVFLDQKAYVCVSEQRLIKIFDLNNLTLAPKQIEINAKKPRALSVDPIGKKVFVSVFDSSNKTAIVPFNSVREAGGAPPPKPSMAEGLPPAPRTGLIVKEIRPNVWADENGDTKWTKYIPYSIEDIDLVIINASEAQPKLTEIRSIGTHISNTVLDPSTNKLFIVNTESDNLTRFEPNIKGKFIDTRISILDLSSRNKVTSVSLNPHINYDNPTGNREERQLSIGLPLDITTNKNGVFYVSSLSTAKVAVLDNSGKIIDRIPVGFGPTGLTFDSGRQQLYVLNRFEASISTINSTTNKEISKVSIGYNPEPRDVQEGRKFMYGGEFSAHGDISCASCHRDSHRDGLAWDLGDPRGKLETIELQNVTLPFFDAKHTFHPMKGPMVTQSFRGIIGTEPLHWRGDRAKFEDFNAAFVSLLGSPRILTDTEMAKFKTFTASLQYPPNPIENLDRTYPVDAERGRQLFNVPKLDAGLLRCIDCHETGSSGFGPGTNQLIAPNFLLVGATEGTDVNVDQNIKVPQLRGLYEKFGVLPNGKTVSGFAFINDGYRRNVIEHIGNPRNFIFEKASDMKDVEAYLLAFDTGTAPTVGLQATVNAKNKQDKPITKRIKLLMAEADKGNCDLIVKGIFEGKQRGLVYAGNRKFRFDKDSDARIAYKNLMAAIAEGQELTFTGVPVGEGYRMGIDRDNNQILDGDEQ